MGKPCSSTNKLTREFLFQAYHVENRSILSIAREVGCRNGTIVKLLQDYGLSKTMTKEWMVEHYVTLEEHIDEIALQLEIDESTVRYYLRRFNIPIRYKSRGRPQNELLNDPEQLHELYVVKQYSLHALADFAECNVSSVVHALTRYSISRNQNVQGIPVQSRRRSFVGRNRKLILERDSNRCRFPECGNTAHLELHHIIPIAHGGLDTVENGITLCKHHHISIAAKELDYIELFQTIVNQEPLT